MKAQPKDSINIAIDSVNTDTIKIVIPKNTISNQKTLVDFFKKLQNLEQNQIGKINVLHLGDSHIQADLMTSKVRKKLQAQFGNAGRGFVFPYSLARTNGSGDVSFSSNYPWKAYRNIFPANGYKVGISGISLTNKNSQFAIEIKANNEENFFTSIKIITPQNNNYIGISLNKVLVADEVKMLKKITHRVKRGETLSEISEKYNVSIDEIRKANRIKKNKIQKGKTLKIPTTETEIKQVAQYKFEPIQTIQNTNNHSFTTDKALERIYLIANQNTTDYDLNGLVLENNNPGILYHSIGVNGARFSDYNKYPLFFEQLSTLNLDLLIISLGTNESFEKLTTDKYLLEIQKFIDNVKKINPNIPIIFTTPPPSLFKRRNLNTIAMDYAEKLTNFANNNGYALWDMYAQMGGVYSVNRNFSAGLVNTDKVHYTKNGYEKQGELLAEAILQAYQNFINPTDFK